ncbi:hypothetical protein DRP04_00165 [Archaeoglobales archaeon]|jgi:hypothetical protein|nr:MAG: hypothetical protein DRP04_00165 [Archaeoglobales archaeon]HDM76732.1 hypothetical protein [Deltaproteobacteria bacterium]
MRVLKFFKGKKGDYISKWSDGRIVIPTRPVSEGKYICKIVRYARRYVLVEPVQPAHDYLEVCNGLIRITIYYDEKVHGDYIDIYDVFGRGMKLYFTTKAVRGFIDFDSNRRTAVFAFLAMLGLKEAEKEFDKQVVQVYRGVGAIHTIFQRDYALKAFGSSVTAEEAREILHSNSTENEVLKEQLNEILREAEVSRDDTNELINFAAKIKGIQNLFSSGGL